jgi:hypothetical protein
LYLVDSLQAFLFSSFPKKEKEKKEKEKEKLPT